MTNIARRGLLLGAAGATAALGLAACSSDDPAASTSPSQGGGAMGTIRFGFIPSWTDGLSTAYLLANRYEAMGYSTEMETLSEPAPLYAGLAKGDVDMYPSAWPDVTHASYMEEYGDDIEDLDTYYDSAKLTIAVPDYLEISSIADLKGRAKEFDGKIIGIEPGAGLTKATKEKVIPMYELGDEYELVTSSTTAMLAELKKATNDKKPIVVTLWRPFWANSTFKVKDLEDPKKALGDTEGLHFLGHKGFSEKFPKAAKWTAGVKLNDEQYGSLEDTVVNQFGKGKEADAVKDWLDKNPDVLPALPA